MNSRRHVFVATLAAALVACGPSSQAQPRRPQATVTAVPGAQVAAGGETSLELKVKLPPRMHVQSNKPSDPAFIPTVLTVDAPKGVTVADVIYPASEKLKQEGLAEPLIVYGSEFSLRARVRVARDVAPGQIVVPASLRYQACDETTCYPPARVEAKWAVQVSAARRADGR